MKYSISAFDVSEMSINSVVNTDLDADSWLRGETLKGTFSSGVKYYKVLGTNGSAFSGDSYELWYYDGSWDDTINDYVHSGVNKNYETGSNSKITTLTEFISEHAHRKESIYF